MRHHDSNHHPRCAAVAAMAAGLAGVCPLSAEETVETVVVTAERGDSELWRTPASVRAIDAEEIRERGDPLQVTDLLAGESGVTLIRNGGVGGLTNLRIRGAQSYSTEFLLDGIPVSDPAGMQSQFDASFLNPAGLDSIELVKGPQSGLYGSRAVGGVVNFRRLRPGDRFGGSVRSEYGSYDTMRLDGRVSGPLGGGLGLACGVSALRSDGFSVLTEPDADGDPRHHEADAFERNGLYSCLEYKLGGLGTAWANLDLMRGYSEYDVTSPDDPDAVQEHDRSAVQAGCDEVLGEQVRGATRAAFTRYQRRYPGAAFGNRDFLSREIYASQQLDWAPDKALGLGGGLDFAREEVATSPADAFTLPLEESADRVGVWVQGLWHLKREGAGFNGVEAQANLRYDEHSAEGDALTWKFGLASFFLEERWKWFGSVSSGFRAPTLYELYAQDDWGGGPVGNPDLEPEETIGGEFGHAARLPYGLGLTNTAFLTRYGQAILYDLASNRYRNIRDPQSVRGLESQANWAPRGVPLALTLTHTWQRAEEDLASRLPENQGSASATWYPIAEAWVSATLLAAETCHEVGWAGARPRIDAWTRLDCAAGWRFAEHWRLDGRIENLLDRHYETADGYSTTGLAAFAGLGATF